MDRAMGMGWPRPIGWRIVVRPGVMVTFGLSARGLAAAAGGAAADRAGLRGLDVD